MPLGIAAIVFAAGTVALLRLAWHGAPARAEGSAASHS
jgi:hypothetical protein